MLEALEPDTLIAVLIGFPVFLTVLGLAAIVAAIVEAGQK